MKNSTNTVTEPEAPAISDHVNAQAFRLLNWINTIQQQNDVTGDIFEICCFHSESSLYLSRLIDGFSEQLDVCAMFGQHGTSPPTIKDDFDVLHQRMAPLQKAGLPLRVLNRESKQLSYALKNHYYRLFHIVGRQNYEGTRMDLELAARFLIDKGVIIMDDPFRPEWPAVTQATIHFLDENSEFRPIIIGFNKLLIVKRTAAELYLKELRQRDKITQYGLGYPYYIKELPFKNKPLFFFYVPSSIESNSGLPMEPPNAGSSVKKSSRSGQKV